MKKNTVRLIISFLLSAILTVFLSSAIISMFAKTSLFSEDLLIKQFEKNDVYGSQANIIYGHIEDDVLNSGVDEAFVRSIQPDIELLRASINASAINMLGGSAKTPSSDDYKAKVKECFTNEALRQGITDEKEIDSVVKQYTSDMMDIYRNNSSLKGDGTLHKIVVKIEDKLILIFAVCAAISLVLAVMIFYLNAKNGPYISIVPFTAVFVLFAVTEIIYYFKFVAHSYTVAVKSAMIAFANAFVLKCLAVSAVLLAAAVIVTVLINKKNKTTDTEVKEIGKK